MLQGSSRASALVAGALQERLFGAVALLLGVGLGRHRTQLAPMTWWLAPTLLAGGAGHALLELVAG